ncbi:MAG: RpoL/Rpb11 RNA polymerase subunit family protein [Nanoarchaeota archaeon]
MQINVLKLEKDEADLQIDNITVAEVLRVYLNKQDVDFAAWRKEHPSKPIVMKIKSSNVSRSVVDAVNAIKKDCTALVSEIKK